MSTDKTLPPKLRMGIRDLFEAEQSQVNTELKKLNSLVGLSYTLSVPWPLLRDGIPETTFDNDTFIRVASNTPATFLGAVHRKLEADTNDFVDKFLTKTQKSQTFELALHPSTTSSTHFSRFSETGSLALFLPHVKSAYQGVNSDAFGNDIEAALEGPTKNPADPMSRPAEQFNLTPGAMPRGKDGPTPLPTLQSLPRPDNLLAEGPLHLMLQATSEAMYLDGHQETVSLVHDYLNYHSDPELLRRLGVQVWLKMTLWGVVVNQLVVKYDHYHADYPGINPLVVVSLVEWPLKFERLEGAQGENGTWLWTREKASE